MKNSRGWIISGCWLVPGFYAPQANGKLVLAPCVVTLGWTASPESPRVGI